MKKITSKTADFGGVSYTVKHTGKMKGLQSVSTSPLKNELCKKRQQHPETVCANCFAVALMNRYKNANPAFMRNTEILSNTILRPEQLPQITADLFRFEAFGDLNNATQVINYFNIAKANPRTLCALWTKNPWKIAEAIEQGATKPDNLQIIFSSSFLNNESTPAAKFDFIDKTFTVYTPAEIESTGVVINCGARSCNSCRRCYLPNPDGVKLERVREKLK